MEQVQLAQEQHKVVAINGINATLMKFLEEMKHIRVAQQQIAQAAVSKK